MQDLVVCRDSGYRVQGLNSLILSYKSLLSLSLTISSSVYPALKVEPQALNSIPQNPQPVLWSNLLASNQLNGV